jgi:glycosyltransferase 2 family protein
MSRRTLVRSAIGLPISALFLWLALRGADLEEAVRLIRGADPLLVGLAAVVLMFGIWLRAVRWRILLKPLGPTTLTQSFSALTIGYLANNALPARLGEIVRVVILHRDAGIPRAGSLGTILVERLFDVLTLLLLLGVAAIASGWENPWAGAFGLAGIGAVVGLAVTYAIAARAVALPGSLERRWRPWRARLPQRVVELGAGFLAGFANVASAGAVARVLLLSIASWTVEASVYFLVMRAMDIKAGGMWMATLVSSLSNLAGVIPAGPANLGPFEYFAKETLLGFAVSAEVAVAFAVAAHLLIIVPPSVIGGLLLLRGGFRGSAGAAAR